ncbi:MAG: TonB-dependent receptor [Erythrobacter sp.]|uniref:TonB-dependent receptor n=1 Tax=Erythrobacter sp. TaxID=1042 RepID=UPI0025DF906C|nr:TonB-dependent receptor [Erythrobacter sp.]MCL9998610.1 TonB-dependent receptor [Erythrobacter sp.]
MLRVHRGNLPVTHRSALALSAALPALLIGLAAPVHAQERTDADPDGEDVQVPGVPVIVVTATKREQTLQEAPVAVSVVGAEEIERAEVQDLLDLQTLVPSLAVRQGQTSGNTTFFIRGFGNGQNAIGLEPSVGVFVDGVYRSRSAAAISDLPNLERVEVLRGPQSTLFGKNASAGIISVTTRKPQFEWAGAVEASIGNYDLRRFDAYATGPLTGNLAASLSGNYNRRDGFFEDLGTGTDTNQRDRWGVRGDILWEPSLDISFRLIADYDKIDEVCCGVTNVIEGPTGANVRAIGGQFVSENPFSYEVYYDVVPTNAIENAGVSLQGDVDFGFAALTSITAYRSNSNASDFDADVTDLSLFSKVAQQSEIETFTQEIRLQSVGAGKLIDWTIGGFYFDEKLEVSNQIANGTDYRRYLDSLIGSPQVLVNLTNLIAQATGTPPPTLGGAGQGITDNSRQDNTAWSIFASADLNITDRLTATFGISYTEDEKAVSLSAVSTEVLSSQNLDQLGYAASLSQLLVARGVNPTNPAQVGGFIQTNPQVYAQLQQQALAVARGPSNPFNAVRALQPFPAFLGFPNAVEDGRSNDNSTDFTARLAYEVTDNINVYASYATGFKATSWNLSRQSRPVSGDYTPGNPVFDRFTQRPVFVTPASPITNAGLSLVNLSTGTRFAGPEDAEVYELGLKAAFDRLSFNLTVFDQTIQNFQTNVFLDNGFVLANAAEQSTFGVEFDFTWNPYQGLILSGGATFLDPVYDSFPNFGNGIDVSGQQPQGIAETQFSLAANYGFTIGDLDAFVRADWQHIGDAPFFDDPAQEAIIDAAGFTREQNLINTSLGIRTQSGFAVSLWARNLFNDEYLVFATPTVLQVGSFSSAPGQPRTFGVTLRKSF